VEIGRALVLVFTKADLLEAPRAASRRTLAAQVGEHLRFVEFAPQLLVSSVSGRDTQRVFPAVRAAYEQWNRRVPTAELNRFFEAVVAAHPPPSHHGRLVRLYYITQADVRPPTFVVMTNTPAGVPEAYRRYLANRIREQFGFHGTPFRLFLRPKKERKKR
jgi:GTP-binding protein